MNRFHCERTSGRILYAGDDDLDRAAVYLSTILLSDGHGLDYVPSAEPMPDRIVPSSYGLIILSDYPAARLTPDQARAIADAVQHGSSLLMIGGWESFSGQNREYTSSPIAEVLPVHLADGDDRRNLAQGLVLIPDPAGAFAQGFPWHRPPIVGGFNEFRPKEGARNHLSGAPLTIAGPSPVTARIEERRYPLLVTSPRGDGFSAALAFDLAPHWVGGFVDWGNQRLTVESDGRAIEVGHLYAAFVRRLISVCMRKGAEPL